MIVLWNVWLFTSYWGINLQVEHPKPETGKHEKCILFQVLIRSVLNNPEEKLYDMVALLITAHQECLERINVSHNDYQNFDDLCEEVLIRDSQSLLHFLMDNLPNPLCLWSSLPICTFCKESLDEFYDQSVVVDRKYAPEFLLVVSTLKGDGHESKLKHVVLGFVVAGTRLNFL